MPKKVSQKQKQKQRQTVIVNVGSTKPRTRRKKSTGKRGKSNITIVPPPVHQVYTSPIHNLTPQYFSGGQQLSIPSLAEQQIGSQIKNANTKNEMDMSLIERMQKQINANKNTMDEINSYMDKSQPSGYSLDDISEISSIYSNPESDWYSRNSVSNKSNYSLSKEMSENIPRESNEEFLNQYYGNKINNSKNNSMDKDLLQRMERQINDESSGSYYGPRIPINPREQEQYFNKMDNIDLSSMYSDKSGSYDLGSMYSDASAKSKSLGGSQQKYNQIISWLDRELAK